MNVKKYHSKQKFWKTVKTFFSSKSSSFGNIYLTEQDKVITDDNKIAKNFNDYFSDIMPDSGLMIPDV